jgi:CRISPR-associated protein Csb1
MTGDELAVHDEWLTEGADAKVALVRREHLLPVSGPGGVIFPPTFAPPPKERGERASMYVTDDLPGGTTVLLDSVGSQANRMEALFLPPAGPFRDIVPQIEFTASRGSGKPEVRVNLIEAGHRAADALTRFSDLEPEITAAFRAIEEGADYAPMARLSPLSLVFGVWDSRGFSGTRTKVPRMVTSVVRAFDVALLHRGAQFVPALRRRMDKGEIEALVGVTSDDKLSEDGLAEAPSYGLGGIVSRGPILREGVLSLVALRNLRSRGEAATLKLRRYILGLALVSLSAPLSPEYRSGCILVPDPKAPTQTELVSRDGSRATIALGDAGGFARTAAADFGLDHEVVARTFDWKRVQKVVKEKRSSRGGESG